MFCTNCGAKYDGGEKFCTVCGSALKGETKADSPVLEAENDLTPEIETNFTPEAENQGHTTPTADGFYAGSAPMGGVPSYVSAAGQAKTPEKAENTVPQGTASRAFSERPDVAFYAVEPPKKKKSPGKAVGYTVAALLTVALILTGVFYPYISNFVAKATLSPTEYMQRVLKANAEDDSSSIAYYYDALVGTYWSEDELDDELDLSASRELTASLEISDTLVKIEEGTSGEDISWLDGLYANAVFSTAGKGSIDKQALDLSLGIGDTEVITVSIVSDAENGDGYISVPNYSDKYLHIKNAGLFAELDEISGTEIETPNFFDEKPEFLPDTNTLYYMLIRYSNALIDAIDEAEKSNEVLEVGELSKKFTVLETKIGSDDMTQMLKNVLEKFKDDEDMKAIIDGIAEYVGEELSYDEICDDLEKYIAELEENEDEDEIVLKIWVDGKGAIAAWDLSHEDHMNLRFAGISKGKVFAAEASIDTEDIHLSASAGGEVKNNILTANAAISGEDGGLLNIEISDFDVRKLDTPYAEGKIVITPGDYAKDYIASEIKDLAANTNSYSPEKIDDFDVRLEISFSGKELDASLVSGTEEHTFLALKLTYTAYEEPLDIAVPSGDNVLDYDNEDESALWYESLDTEKLTETFEKVGIPEDFIYNLIYGGFYDEEYSAYDDGYYMGYNVGYLTITAANDGEEAAQAVNSGMSDGYADFENGNEYNCVNFEDDPYYEAGYDLGYYLAMYDYYYSDSGEYDEYDEGYIDGFAYATNAFEET